MIDYVRATVLMAVLISIFITIGVLVTWFPLTLLVIIGIAGLAFVWFCCYILVKI